MKNKFNFNAKNWTSFYVIISTYENNSTLTVESSDYECLKSALSNTNERCEKYKRGLYAIPTGQSKKQTNESWRTY